MNKLYPVTVVLNGANKKKKQGKIMIKKLAVIICAAMLALSFAACNENTDTKESADSSVTSEVGTTAAEDTTAAETTAEDTTAAVETTAAAKVEDANIIGSWEFELGGYTYTFNDDGTGKYDVVGGVMTFTYEADGSKLTLNYDGGLPASELEYKLDGDKLNVKDSMGNDTIYYKK